MKVLLEDEVTYEGGPVRWVRLFQMYTLQDQSVILFQGVVRCLTQVGVLPNSRVNIGMLGIGYVAYFHAEIRVAMRHPETSVNHSKVLCHKKSDTNKQASKLRGELLVLFLHITVTDTV